MMYLAVATIYKDLDFERGSVIFDQDALNLFPPSTSQDIIINAF
jgi:hypothetical protein